MVAKKEAENEDSLDSQIKHLEDTFDRVKDSLAVRSYEEFFNRYSLLLFIFHFVT